MGDRARAGARLRRLVAAAVPAVVTAALVAGTIAARTPPQTVRLEGLQVWLAAPGRLVLVDGATAQAVRALAVDLVPTKVYPLGADAVAVTADRGLVLARYAEQTLAGSRAFTGSDRVESAVVGGGRVYTVSVTGTIGRLDVGTLGFRTVGARPDDASLAVDAAGRLWQLDRRDGRVSLDGRWTDAGGGPAVNGTLVPGPDVVLVDAGGRHLSLPSRPGQACAVGGDLRRAALSAGDRPGRILAASPADGTIRLLTVPGRDGRCGSSVLHLAPGRKWGEPLLSAGRIFLPDIDHGRVRVVDAATGRVLAAPRVTAAGAVVTLIQRAGLVFFNEAAGEAAGVVHPDGTVVRITKTVPAKDPTAAGGPVGGNPTTTTGSPTRQPSVTTSSPATSTRTTGSPGRPSPTRRPAHGATPSPSPRKDIPLAGAVRPIASVRPSGQPSTTAATTAPTPTGTDGPPGSAPVPTTSPARDLQLSLSARGSRVTSDPPGIDCPGSCQARFPPGTAIALVATSTGGTPMINGAGCPGTEVCHLTLDTDTTLSAVVLGPAGELGGPDGVAVLQPRGDDGAPLRSLDLAWVDSHGRLLYGRGNGHLDTEQHYYPLLTDPDWVVLSQPGAFTGKPELVDGPGAGLAIVAQGTDGRIWGTSTPAAPNGVWTPWVTLAEGELTLLDRALPKLAPDRCPVALGLAADGGLWRMTPPLRGTASLARQVGAYEGLAWASAAAEPDGDLRVAGVGADGAVHVGSLGCDSDVTGWSDLGGSSDLEPPVLAVHPDGHLHVFVRAAGYVFEQEERDGWRVGDWTRTGDLWPAGRPGVVLNLSDWPFLFAPDPEERVLGWVDRHPDYGWSIVHQHYGVRRYGATDVYAYFEPELDLPVADLVVSRRLDDHDRRLDVLHATSSFTPPGCEERVNLVDSPGNWGLCSYFGSWPLDWAAPDASADPVLRVPNP